MKLPNRRQFLHLAARAAGVADREGRTGLPGAPARIIVGFPAGGGAAPVARLMGQCLSERVPRAAQEAATATRIHWRHDHDEAGAGRPTTRESRTKICFA